MTQPNNNITTNNINDNNNIDGNNLESKVIKQQQQQGLTSSNNIITHKTIEQTHKQYDTLLRQDEKKIQVVRLITAASLHDLHKKCNTLNGTINNLYDTIIKELNDQKNKLTKTINSWKTSQTYSLKQRTKYMKEDLNSIGLAQKNMNTIVNSQNMSLNEKQNRLVNIGQNIHSSLKLNTLVHEFSKQIPNQNEFNQTELYEQVLGLLDWDSKLHLDILFNIIPDNNNNNDNNNENNNNNNSNNNDNNKLKKQHYISESIFSQIKHYLHRSITNSQEVSSVIKYLVKLFMKIYIILYII